LQQMKFGETFFPYNPASLKISYAKHIIPRFSPFGGSIVENYGSEPIRVSGEGELPGPAASAAFAAVKTAFSGNASQTLIAGEESFPAFFETLTWEADAQSGAIRYRFSFVEEVG
jgi:hypothetical protein